MYYTNTTNYTQGSRVRNGVNIHPNGSSTSLTFTVSSNFNRTSNDGNEFTCQFTNSEGITNKTFRINLKSADVISNANAGMYAAIGIGIPVFIVLLSFLLRNIFLMKVSMMISIYILPFESFSAFFHYDELILYNLIDSF